jgi:hypothetical protein
MPRRAPYSELVSTRSILALAYALAPGFGIITSPPFFYTPRGGVCAFDDRVTPLSMIVQSIAAWLCWRARSRARALTWMLLGVGGAASVPLVRVFGLPDVLFVWLHTIVPPVTLHVAFVTVLAFLLWPDARRPVAERTDRAAIVAASWIAAHILVRLVFVEGHASPIELLPYAAVAFLVVATATARISARRRWLAAVGAGCDPRWRLIDDSGPMVDGVPWLVMCREPMKRKALVATDAQSQSFRSNARGEPTAYVGLCGQ